MHIAYMLSSYIQVRTTQGACDSITALNVFQAYVVPRWLCSDTSFHVDTCVIHMPILNRLIIIVLTCCEIPRRQSYVRMLRIFSTLGGAAVRLAERRLVGNPIHVSPFYSPSS
jgi:hypothetical protein